MIVKTVFIIKKEQLPIEENVNIVRWIVKIYKVNHHNIEKKTNKTTVLLVKYGGDTMARAKIYCEITCNNCGGVLKGSGYYKNSSIIAKLKESAKEANWVWDEEFCGNLCPSCQEEIKKERKSGIRI